jgi:DNA-binding transcriptional LysR family regulator
MTNLNVSESINLRYDDALKLISVYERAKKESCPHFKSLFETLGPHTTTLGAINRLVEFLNQGIPHSIQKLSSEALFSVPSGEASLKPTRVADVLVQLLRGLEPFYTYAKERIWRELSQAPGHGNKFIRLGASQTLGLRLLSSILSIKQPIPRNCDLEFKIDSSNALIQQLNLGSLDLVLSWGPETFRLRKHSSGIFDFLEPDLDVRFVSLGYSSKMVLLASPRTKLELNDGSVVMRNEVDKSNPSLNARRREQRTEEHPKPHYDDLVAIRPWEIRFSKTLPLIYVPSWNQPLALSNLAADLRQKGFLQEGQFYDEALSLVRMSRGVAVASEVFSKRRGVFAMRMQPEAWYTRDIGIYYNTRIGLSESSCCLAEFIRHYLSTYETEIRNGFPPSAYNNKEKPKVPFNVKFVDDFMNKHDNWEGLSSELYPIISKSQ